MKIDYTEERTGGIYFERMLRKSQSNYKSPPVTEEQLKASEEARKKIEGVDITMSPESIEFMASVKERKEAAKIERERIEKENSAWNKEDPFEMTGGAITQFFIISRALDEKGFYDDKSDEEVLEIEDLLISITHGISDLHGGRDGIASELSSHAASFELESSTAALRQFSEKYLPEELKESFSDLIDKYYKHNENVLEGYKSTEENRNEFSAELYDRTGKYRVILPDQKEKMMHIAGKIQYSEEDKDNAVREWKACFDKLRDGSYSVDEAMNRMRDTLLQYASGNSENKGFLQYMQDWNEFAIKNARSYWSLLMGS